MNLFVAPLTYWFFVTIQLSLMASILVAVILILQRSLRSRFSPYWHYALWTLFLMRLIVPWTPETSFSPYNWLPVHSWSAVDTQLFKINPVGPVPEAELTPIPVSASVNVVPSEVTLDAEPYSSTSFVIAVWLVGMFVFCTYALYRYWRIAKRVGPAKRILDPALIRTLEQCRMEMSIHRGVQLIDLSGFNGIALYGLWRPRIIAPRKLLCSLSEAELRHVFTHELAHLKHHDILVSWICLALQGIHWFNPIVWYGFYRMRLDREAASDYRVLRQFDSDVSYGRTLLSVFEKIQSPDTLPGMVGIVENKSLLKRRIEMITQHNNRAYRYPLIGAIVLLLTGTVFLSGAQSESNSVDSDDIENKYPYTIPIKMYEQPWSAFQLGDEIVVTELRGTSPRIEEGASYRVSGTYTLGSQDGAMLHVYATSGAVSSRQGPDVAKGNGIFVREFTLDKMGDLHVNYYPLGGGSGFGGIYFRWKPKDDGSPDAFVDLAIDDAHFLVKEYPHGDLHQMIVIISNQGNAVVPEFDIFFYRGDPETSEPMTNGGNNLYPDAMWTEGSMPFELDDGLHHFYVKIDPHNKVLESDETNNTAELKFRVKAVTKVVHEIELID